MIRIIKKYKAFLYGLIIFRVIVLLLSYFNLILVDNSEYLSNILSFIFYWLFFSLPIYYFPFLKKHKIISLKLLGLIALFFLVILNDANSRMVDNPITFIGIISIGMLFFSIIAPKFFKKYAFFTLVFYVLGLGYFIYLRVYFDDINIYLQQEKEIKIILTVPFLVLIFGWLFQQWKWLKTLESKKSKAELSLLKSQINPHFLFNTLNNLYGLIVEKSEEAPEVVLKLSEMLRYTIYEGKEDVVSLRNEIIYLENYIALHKIRYQKNVEIHFTHEIEKDLKIAPLLFIILLENAFKHGVEKLTKDAYIHLELKSTGNQVVFQIENNCEAQKNPSKKGIGLDNLMQRLSLIYPKKHTLEILNEKTVYKTRLKIDCE